MPAKKDSPSVSHEGHRQRMKDRYLASGLESFQNHEVLELLLFYGVPYRDTNELAHRLIDTFGGFANVLEADYADLVAQPGISGHTAVLLRLIRDVCRRYEAEIGGQVTQLCTTGDYIRHITPWFLGERKESVVMLSMDNKRKLLNCTRIFEGSVNSAQFSMRQAVQQALRDNATAVVLAHNHPNGFAIPSEADLNTTRRFAQILRAMDILLVDHLIIAENDCVSMAYTDGCTDCFGGAPSDAMVADGQDYCTTTDGVLQP